MELRGLRRRRASRFGVGDAIVPAMNPSDLVERVASLETLSSLPREELEWLARHGEVAGTSRAS